MRTTILCAIVGLFATMQLVAQGDNMPADGMEDRMVREMSGDMALLFDLSGLGSLGLNAVGLTVNNESLSLAGGVGIKHFVADQLAVRASLGFANSKETTYGGIDDTVTNEETFTSFTIAPGVIYNLNSNENVAGYVGGEVEFGMSTSEQLPAGEEEGSTSTTETSFGIGALLGAEWFPWNNVSVSGEYSIMYGMSSGTRESTFNDETTERKQPEATAIGIVNQGRILVSFYVN